MRIESSRLECAAARGPAVVAAGFFDGFHIGHRAVAEAAIAEARRTGAEAWALTFAEHPLATLAPDRAPPLLTATPARLGLLEGAGFDGACLVSFDAGLAALSQAEFAARLKVAFPGLLSVHCGGNWRFGAGGRGTAATLAELGGRLGFAVAAEPPVTQGGAPVSSTRIRAALAEGRLDAAAAMLGRPWTLCGAVVHGRRLGSAGGVPTANVATDGLALPPPGVYAVSALADGARLFGVADLGWRPTFPDDRPESPILEVNFLDFSGDLYGRVLEVEFIKRLRGEMAFPAKEALFAQIARDISAAREIAGTFRAGADGK